MIPGAMVVGRELTKLHEEYLRDTLEAICKHLPLLSRGENLLCCLRVLNPKRQSRRRTPGGWLNSICRKVYRHGGGTKSGAGNRYARNELYRYLIEKKKSE